MNDLRDRLRDLTDRRDRASVVGVAVTAMWLLLVVLFWLFGPDGTPQGGLARLASVVGVLLPPVLIWTAVGMARAIADLRAEAVTLRARLEAVRPLADDPAAALPVTPGLAAAASVRPAAAAARPTPRAAEPRRDAQQTDLPFEQPRPVEISPADLVAALNFPDGPDDHAAIAAMRTALTDPETARTIRAAQDVVTLLAKHGVYMDDLDPAPAPAGAWRRFLDGQRGNAGALAAIDDAQALDAAATLMRGDEVFRDAAHHFLRQYDRTLTRAAPGMDDAALDAAIHTRSGRAYVLLAQVAGVFG